MTDVTCGLSTPGGQERELERAVAPDDGVAGVGPAVVPHDVVEVVAEEVGDLAFGFVAPLQADDTRCGHESFRDGRVETDPIRLGRRAGAARENGPDYSSSAASSAIRASAAAPAPCCVIHSNTASNTSSISGAAE